MHTESLAIEIDGETAEDLYEQLVGLDVLTSDKGVAEFHIFLSTFMQTDGSWPLVDDERLTLWKSITIYADFEDGTQVLIEGYITLLRSVFNPDPTLCTIEVVGMDASVLMDRREVLKDWPDKKDSDIAAAIFSNYALAPEVEDTEVIHDSAISTIIQRETDLQFLQRLALRNGFECYVEGGTGYFRAPNLSEPPQPVLAAQFGAETTVSRFTAEVDALAPADVAMFQIDRVEKETLTASVATADLPTLGSRDATSLLGGQEPGQVFIGMNATTGMTEMELLCRGLYNAGQWFVRAEGEVIANRYGHVLRPRKTVTIKGVGETHSGIYYVTSVAHAFTSEGYTQRFKAQRNGLMPTGAEVFSEDVGLLDGVL